MSRDRIELGKQNEARAERYLTGLGYDLLARSCRTRFGEIDLIMRDGDTLVFVEVRSRSNSGFGNPEESVNYRKQRKICRVASAYLQSNRLNDVPVRFDVIGIMGDSIRHIQNAFSAGGYTF